jgi:hypothetical protein
MALPDCLAVLDHWYMSSLISGERPGQPQRLTLRQPHPGNETILEPGRPGGRLLAASAGRLTLPIAVGVLFHWLT